MALKNLTTLVLKTATVAGVKPTTPADRIGLGFAAVVATPADHLSPGQLPLPPYPGSESNPGSRQEPPTPPMREQTWPMATAAAPVGPTGCPVPGITASRRPSSLTARAATTERTAAAGRLASLTRATEVRRSATPSRAGFHAGSSLHSRIGCDCQSPDRKDDRWPATTEIGLATATRK